MDITKKIEMAAAYSDTSQTAIASALGTTPQSLYNRKKVGKFSTAELEKIAEALGAKYVCYFEFPDGTKI